MSTPPRAVIASATTALACEGSPMSPETMACPAPCNVSTTAFAASTSLRQCTATVVPAAASAAATAAPTPRDPPVTRARASVMGSSRLAATWPTKPYGHGRTQLHSEPPLRCARPLSDRQSTQATDESHAGGAEFDQVPRPARHNSWRAGIRLLSLVTALFSLTSNTPGLLWPGVAAHTRR